MDVIFSDGDFQERLPLTGDQRHAFLRATTEKATLLEPLLRTVRTQSMLKEALWHKARPYRSTGIAKVEAPLLIIPDVHVCNAFNPDQAGALGGSAVVVAAEADDCSSIIFTESAAGKPDAMFIPIASHYTYEPAQTASGVLF